MVIGELFTSRSVVDFPDPDALILHSCLAIGFGISFA